MWEASLKSLPQTQQDSSSLFCLLGPAPGNLCIVGKSSLQALGSSDGTPSPRSAHVLGGPYTIPDCEPTRARMFLQRGSQSLSVWLGALTPLSPSTLDAWAPPWKAKVLLCPQ